MSTYTGSKAQTGRGAILAIGGVASVTGTPTWVPIFEVKKTSLKNQWDKVERTNFNSTYIKEYGKTMLDGSISLSGGRVSSDAGQAALTAAFLDGNNAYKFQLTYPLAPGQTTTGDIETFNALVMSASRDIDTEADIEFSIDLQITYLDTLTVGS